MSAEPSIPPIVSGHTLLRPIGRGSYGEVWLARENGGAWRAVKVVRRDAFEGDRPFERERCGLEISVTATRYHDGLVTIHHVGQLDNPTTEDAHFHYTMDLADDCETGRDIDPAKYQPRTLEHELKYCGRLPLAEAISVARQLASALTHLHAQGLVHRDVKPPNVIFIDGRPQLADVGLMAEQASSISQVGTPGYVSLEGVGRATGDLHALGLVLYEMATGCNRWDFPDFPSGIADEAETAALSAVNEVVMRACSPNPAQRYETAAEMAADLDRLANGQRLARYLPVQCRRWTMTTAAAVLGGLVWLAFNWMTSPVTDGPLERGLAVHYEFNGNVSDTRAPRAYSGTAGAIFGPDRHGQNNAALHLVNDASAGCFTGREVALRGTNLTVGLWFKPNIVNFERALVAQSWINGGTFLVSIKEGRLAGQFRGQEGNLQIDGPPVRRHAWQHAAWVYDATSGRAAIYHNGALVAEAQTTGPLPPSNSALTAGWGTSAKFAGLLDDLRVYDRALSAAEVANWFNSEAPPAARLEVETWDFEYSYQDVFDPEADRYLFATNAVRKYLEPRDNNISYWGPEPRGNTVTSEVVYRFPFDRPAREIFLYTTLHTWDLATLGLAEGQGTGALRASRDGTNWVTLRDLMHPGMRFGSVFEYSDLLPPSLTGTREVYIKIVMSVHATKPGLNYSTAHHSANGKSRRNYHHNLFELKARFD
jgi:hypothetical protein